MNQQNLFDFEGEGIENPFYDPELAEAERLADEQYEREYQEKERKKQAEREARMKADGLEYQICCAHVSHIDGSAYAVKVLAGYEPKYVIYSDGLPEDVEAKLCDCNGKGDGWRGGELVNQMYDDDKEANDR